MATRKNSPGDAIAAAAISAAKAMEPYSRTPQFGAFAVDGWINSAAYQRANGGYKVGGEGQAFDPAGFVTEPSHEDETSEQYRDEGEGRTFGTFSHDYPGSVASPTQMRGTASPGTTKYPTSVQ